MWIRKAARMDIISKESNVGVVMWCDGGLTSGDSSHSPPILICIMVNRTSDPTPTPTSQWGSASHRLGWSVRGDHKQVWCPPLHGHPLEMAPCCYDCLKFTFQNAILKGDFFSRLFK